LKPISFLISLLCYGGAIIGTIVAAFILWRI
ncbi:MAG TPA: fumarate reductase subunit D, partial [Candidatus Lambdaproteobacteria bacterium]|nr:fumarate reductase subunit D [Candidatus Lambdaproteobacteria bacterium]